MPGCRRRFIAVAIFRRSSFSSGQRLGAVEGRTLATPLAGGAVEPQLRLLGRHRAKTAVESDDQDHGIRKPLRSGH